MNHIFQRKDAKRQRWRRRAYGRPQRHLCGLCGLCNLCVEINNIFVKLILNFIAKSGGTFKNYSGVLPNFQISRRSKSDGFSDGKIAVFAKCCHTVTYKQVAPSDSPKGGAWASRKGPAGLQRGPYDILAAAPLQSNGVLVAMQ